MDWPLDRRLRVIMLAKVSLPRASTLSFHPFAVQCLTCGSQLRVTDPALVGAISSCPKCGSMVQVDPPMASGADDIAVGRDDIAIGQDDIDSEAITEESVDSDRQFASALPPDLPGGFEGQFDSEASESAPPVALPEAGGRFEGWQSHRTQRTRQIGLVVMLATSLLLFAAIVFGWFVRSWQRSQPSGTPEVVATADAAQSTGPADSSELVKDSEKPEVKPQPAAGVPESDPVPDATTHSSPEEVSAPDSEATRQPAAKTATADGDQLASIPPGLLPTSPLANASAEESTKASPETLVDSKPTANSRNTSIDGPASADDPASGTMQELPPGLAEFLPFTNLASEGPSTPPAMDAPATIKDMQIKAAAEETIDPMMIANPPEPINLDRALAIRFALASNGITLADIALVVSQITGVPIQVDWFSFDLLGQDIAAEMAVTREMRRADEILSEVAGSVGATVVRHDSMLTITPTDQRMAQAAKQATDFSDLGSGEPSAAKLLRRFLADGAVEQDEKAAVNGPADAKSADDPQNTEDPEDAGPAAGEPQEKESDGGEPEDASNLAQQQLSIVAADVIRRMRGAEGRLSDDTLRRWAAPADAADPWRLLRGGDSGPQNDAPETISQLLRRVAKRNDAVCIVNWRDALRRRISPEQLVLPYAGNDAATMLSETLAPFEMQVREVSPGYWWIGTEATYDRLPVVVWTQPLGETRDAFLRRLEAAMQMAPQNGFRVTYDEVSDRALMLLPRFILRQLEEIQLP